MNNEQNIPGIILAGGRARRMGGGDKCLLPLGGKTLLQRSVEKARPQVGRLLLSANGNHLRFARTGLTVLSDEHPEFPGPLAGIHAGLQWLNIHQPEAEWLASFASDTPFFPDDLVAQLYQAARDNRSDIVVARSEKQLHPVFGLWHRSVLEPINALLTAGTTPRLIDWVGEQNSSVVDFHQSDFDPFFNINHPKDLYHAESFLHLAEPK